MRPPPPELTGAPDGRRRLTAEILVDGKTCSGVVTDEAGRRHPFDGWLQLIALLRAGDDHQDIADPTR